LKISKKDFALGVMGVFCGPMENETRPTPETDYEEQIDNGDTKPLFAFCRKLERERDEALQWKREQMLVESQWDVQAVAKELGMPAGTDIRKSILPAIQQLKHERDELREELARMQTMAASVADIVAKRDAMLEAMQDANGALENLIIAKSGGMQPANALIDATFAAKAAVKKLKPFIP
jgi:hypothetical protein